MQNRSNHHAPHAPFPVLRTCGFLCAFLLTACGGGGGGDDGGTGGGPASPPATSLPPYTLSAHVTGLVGQVSIATSISNTTGTNGFAGRSITAADIDANGYVDLAVDSFYPGDHYNLVVEAQPFAQTCTISNGRGEFVREDIANVEISCVTGPTAEPSQLITTFAIDYAAIAGAYAVLGFADPMLALFKGEAPCSLGGSARQTDTLYFGPDAVYHVLDTEYTGCANAFMPGHRYSGSLYAELRQFDLESGAHANDFGTQDKGNELRVTLPGTLFGAELLLSPALANSRIYTYDGDATREDFNGSVGEFRYGPASSYRLTTGLEVGPYGPLGTRHKNGSSVDVTLKSMPRYVTFNGNYTTEIRVESALVWTGGNYPHGGMLAISGSALEAPETKMQLLVTFLNADQFRIDDALRGSSITKSWSDPDVIEALRAAIR